MRPSRLAHWMAGGAAVLSALAAWELFSRTGVLNPVTVPPVTDIVATLVQQFASAQFWNEIGGTARSWAAGLLISAAIALPVGFVLGQVDWAFRSVRLFIEFLRPVPVIAILPLALLLFGTTESMKLILIVFGTVWSLLIQVLYGVNDVDPVLAETARSYRLGYGRRLLNVVIPSATPFIATGIRIAAINAFILSIVTELVGGGQGVGLAILRAQLAGAYNRLYALVFVAGVLGLAVNAFFQRIERHFLRWHPSQREAPAA